MKCELPECKNIVVPRRHSGGSPKRFCCMRHMRKAYDRSYKRSRPGRAHKPSWRKRMSTKEYKTQLEAQRHCCDLCKNPFTKEEPPVLDHNHRTGSNRSLIHNKCNTAIGLLNDSPETCRLAAEYLEKWESDIHF